MGGVCGGGGGVMEVTKPYNRCQVTSAGNISVHGYLLITYVCPLLPLGRRRQQPFFRVFRSASIFFKLVLDISCLSCVCLKIPRTCVPWPACFPVVLGFQEYVGSRNMLWPLCIKDGYSILYNI